MSSLTALEDRLNTLIEQTRSGLSQLAAEDEATKILMQADSLDLEGEDRARRRKLISQVDGALASFDRSSEALSRSSSLLPAKKRARLGVPPVVAAAARRLLAEVSWVSTLLRRAVACCEESYFIAVLPKGPSGRATVVDLLDDFEVWAKQVQLPSFKAECAELLGMIAEQRQVVREIEHFLDDPRNSCPYVQRAASVYDGFLSVVKDALRSDEGTEAASMQIEDIVLRDKRIHSMLHRTVRELQEVKLDIASIRSRIEAMQSHHTVLRLLRPISVEVAQFSVKDLLLLIHLHNIPCPSGMIEKSELLAVVQSANVCAD